MKKVICLFLLLPLFSCSNLSRNMIKEGSFSIKSGVYRTKKWHSTLDFKRQSWYHGLTLLFDLMHTKIDTDSDFYAWFDNDEQARLKDCEEKLVTLSYALDSSRISYPMFRKNLLDNGYEEISTPDFKKSLKTHPDFEFLSLQLYKVNVYCRKKKYEEKIFISFPSFEEITL